jgi:hypothetical protein
MQPVDGREEKNRGGVHPGWIIFRVKAYYSPLSLIMSRSRK